MKKIFFSAIAFCFTLAAYSQDSTGTKKAATLTTHKTSSAHHQKKAGASSTKHTSAGTNSASGTQANTHSTTGTSSNGTMPNADPGKVTTNPSGKTGSKNGVIKTGK